MGYTIEGQITGEERFGGLQIAVHRAKKRKLPAETRSFTRGLTATPAVDRLSAEMGIAAGGRMNQKLSPTPTAATPGRSIPKLASTCTS